MAGATWRWVKSTPYSVVYFVDGDAGGTEGILDYTNSAEYDKLVPGPYKAYIKRGLTGIGFGGSVNQLDKNNLEGSKSERVRIYHVAGIDSNYKLPTTLLMKWVGVGISATLDAGEPPGSLLIEIRFIHSSRR